MNRPALALLAALLAAPAAACSCSQKTEDAAAKTASAASPAPATPHKVQAPVAIDATLGDGAARVTLRFSSPATAVEVNVHGVDGLVVTSAPRLAEGATFTAGEVAAFDVAFSPGPGRSHLAVSVEGLFAGAHRAQVVSFAVGKPAAAAEKAGPARTEGEGAERVKVMPGGKP
jgi:hypothetical protein